MESVSTTDTSSLIRGVTINHTALCSQPPGKDEIDNVYKHNLLNAPLKCDGSCSNEFTDDETEEEEDGTGVIHDLNTYFKETAKYYEFCKCGVPRPHGSVLQISSVPIVIPFVDIDIKWTTEANCEEIIFEIISRLNEYLISINLQPSFYVRNGGKKGGIHIQFRKVFIESKMVSVFLKNFNILFSNILEEYSPKIVVDTAIINYPLPGFCKRSSGPIGEGCYRLYNLENKTIDIDLEPHIIPMEQLEALDWMIFSKNIQPDKKLQLLVTELFQTDLSKKFYNDYGSDPEVDLKERVTTFLFHTIVNLYKRGCFYANIFGNIEEAFNIFKNSQRTIEHTLTLFMAFKFTTCEELIEAYHLTYSILGWGSEYTYTDLFLEEVLNSISIYGGFLDTIYLPSILFSLIATTGECISFNVINCNIKIRKYFLMNIFEAIKPLTKEELKDMRINDNNFKIFVRFLLAVSDGKRITFWDGYGWRVLPISTFMNLFEEFASFCDGSSFHQIQSTYANNTLGEMLCILQIPEERRKFLILKDNVMLNINTLQMVYNPSPFVLLQSGRCAFTSKDIEKGFSIPLEAINDCLNPSRFELYHEDLVLAVRFFYMYTTGNMEKLRAIMGLITFLLTFNMSKGIVNFVGDGNNGKTSFLWILKHAMGNMLGAISPESLRKNNELSSDILENRFCVALLADDQKGKGSLASQMITTLKNLTSGGMGRKRTLFQTGKEIIQDFNIFFCDNDLFTKEDKSDTGLLGRLKEIIFNTRFNTSFDGLDFEKPRDFEKIQEIFHRGERLINAIPKNFSVANGQNRKIINGFIMLLGHVLKNKPFYSACLTSYLGSDDYMKEVRDYDSNRERNRDEYEVSHYDVDEDEDKIWEKLMPSSSARSPKTHRPPAVVIEPPPPIPSNVPPIESPPVSTTTKPRKHKLPKEDIPKPTKIKKIKTTKTQNKDPETPKEPVMPITPTFISNITNVEEEDLW